MVNTLAIPDDYNMAEYTGPLKNAAKLPDHPSDTTAKKIIKYGEVHDAHNGHLLTAGLHDNEIRTLMNGGNPALAHLYRFAIKQVGADKRIYHTRSRVIIEVETENADEQTVNSEVALIA